jgi:DNA-binding transcriptional regulator YiaG
MHKPLPIRYWKNLQHAPKLQKFNDFLAIRLALGMGQKSFADWLGVDRHTVQSWECGNTRPDYLLGQFLLHLAIAIVIAQADKKTLLADPLPALNKSEFLRRSLGMDLESYAIWHDVDCHTVQRWERDRTRPQFPFTNLLFYHLAITITLAQADEKALFAYYHQIKDVSDVQGTRQALGMTQERFAELLNNVDERTLRNWESGATRPRYPYDGVLWDLRLAIIETGKTLATITEALSNSPSLPSQLPATPEPSVYHIWTHYLSKNH